MRRINATNCEAIKEVTPGSGTCTRPLFVKKSQILGCQCLREILLTNFKNVICYFTIWIGMNYEKLKFNRSNFKGIENARDDKISVVVLNRLGNSVSSHCRGWTKVKILKMVFVA